MRRAEREQCGPMSTRKPPTWPVIPLALPAAVSIWAGWVGLGGLTGFGVVQLLPGIWDGLRINTAVTLPIGMEAYAAYALHCWLHRGTPRRAKDFARVSSIAALVLGALGQVAYHLMAASGVQHAPWQIVALVACLPVGVLGMGATLANLLGEDDEPEAAGQELGADLHQAPAVGTSTVADLPPVAPAQPIGPPVLPAFRVGGTAPSAQQDQPGEQSADRSGGSTRTDPAGRPEPVRAERDGSPRKRTGKPKTDAQLSRAVRDLAEQNGGSPPSQYAVRQQFGIGGSRAARLLAELDTTPAGPPASNGAARKEGTR